MHVLPRTWISQPPPSSPLPAALPVSRTSSAQSNLSLFLERGPSSAAEGEGELERQSTAPRPTDSADVSLDESFGEGVMVCVCVCACVCVCVCVCARARVYECVFVHVQSCNPFFPSPSSLSFAPSQSSSVMKKTLKEMAMTMTRVWLTSPPASSSTGMSSTKVGRTAVNLYIKHLLCVCTYILYYVYLSVLVHSTCMH